MTVLAWTQADLDQLLADYARLYAQSIVAERVLAEQAADLEDCRAQIAALSDQLYQAPADADDEAA